MKGSSYFWQREKLSGRKIAVILQDHEVMVRGQEGYKSSVEEIMLDFQQTL